MRPSTVISLCPQYDLFSTKFPRTFIAFTTVQCNKIASRNETYRYLMSGKTCYYVM
jgi:hypothetical protein